MAKYRDAIEWIAENDGRGDSEDAYTLTSYLTVQLVADLFNKEVGTVAEDVYQYRQKHGD